MSGLEAIRVGRVVKVLVKRGGACHGGGGWVVRSEWFAFSALAAFEQADGVVMGHARSKERNGIVNLSSLLVRVVSTKSVFAARRYKRGINGVKGINEFL
jgi:hypothetical protein